jgi:hypothetical protein
MNGILDRTTGGSPDPTSSMPISQSASKDNTARTNMISHGWAAMALRPARLFIENSIVQSKKIHHLAE